MLSKLTIAMALASAVTAAPALESRQNPCLDAYKACVAAGTPQVACSCTLAVCSGEDDARNRSYCATATANLPKPTAPTTAEPSFTSIPGIPGGCNPAHAGSCPSSYFTYPTLTATAAPTPAPAAAAAAAAAAAGSADPQPVEGKTWTIEDLTRYCGEGNTGCDYNFKIEADGTTEACTVIRMPGSNAATENWYDQPCTDGSDIKISWGYAADAAPPFAVITVVDGNEIAWFGVSDVNGQAVTPSNPFGSGQYGNIGPEQVYTN